MLLKGLDELDFINYKEMCMFVALPFCSFKCEKDSGVKCCQNSSLALQPTIEIATEELCERYISNPLSSSVVFGGLEPFDSFNDIVDFIDKLRNNYHCSDTIVIYTGYNKEEILDKIYFLSKFPNIIVKFGRYIPNAKTKYDAILGITLASENQYAEVIS